MDQLESVENLEINDDMRFIAHKDIATCSFIGTYIYLLVWATITIPSNFFADQPVIGASFSLGFLIMALIRGALIKNFENIYGKGAIYWKMSFFPAVWVTASLWGILCYLALTDSRFESISLAIVISTAGFASGSIITLLANRTLATGTYSILILPSAFALFHPNFNNFLIIYIFLIYWVGMHSITKVQYQKYWIALKNNDLIKRHSIMLKQLNTLDGLTGLKNRSFFDQSLQRGMKNAQRSQSQISLLLIDIDHFKMINDNYGHLVGDECLKKISILLQQLLQRDTDVVARYGGEEFAIILPTDNKKNALSLAEKIRKSVQLLQCDIGRKTLSFTVSIGVACIKAKPHDTAEELIKMADKALYQAKKMGRNKVMDAQPAEQEKAIHFDI